MANSEELVGEDGAATNAIDGNPVTVWHTEWAAIAGDANDPVHPHELSIDLGDIYALSGFQYLPRQEHINGRVDAYRLYVSVDGETWGSPVAQGQFANDTTQKTVFFDSQE
jgi:phospholipase C